MTSLRDFLRKRQLLRAIAATAKEMDRALQRKHTVGDGMAILIESGKRTDPLREELDRLITKALVKKAYKLRIDIPEDCWHEVKDPEFPGFVALDRFLQERGQQTVAKLIKKEQRENVEWWVKVLVPILSLIIGILGLVVAGLTVWRVK
jgi:hypothetical protein